MILIRSAAVASLLGISLLTAATADQDGNGNGPLKDLVERLDSDDSKIRKEAAEALEMRSHAAYAALGGLTGYFDDDDVANMDRFRSDAKPLIPQLVKLLEGHQEECRVAAAITLGAIGPDAEKCRPVLRKVIRDTMNSQGLRIAALPALLHVTPPNEVAGRDFVECFSAAFFDGSDDVGTTDVRESDLMDDETAAGSYGSFLAALLISAGRTTTEIPSLVEAMRAKSPRALRLTSITALTILEAEAGSAVPSLRKLLGDDDQLVRKYAGLALVHIESDRTELLAIIKAIALSNEESAAFQDEANDILKRKAEASKRIRDGGRDLVAGVVPMLKHRNSFYQRQAIRMLGEIGPPSKEAISELTALLKSDDKDTRAAAAAALKQIDPSASPSDLRGDSKKQ